jgi:hypothetical protein
VDFDLPRGSAYRPYSSIGHDEVLAFLSPTSSNHPVVPAPMMQDKWQQEHLDGMVYDFGSVEMNEYRDGLHTDSEIDYGKWSRPARSQNNPSDDDRAFFEGAYAWLAAQKGIDKNSADIGDDPEHAHITVGDSIIYVHYSFENNNSGTTNYALEIQRSTGRFKEVFTPSSGESFEKAGTCLVFKR